MIKLKTVLSVIALASTLSLTGCAHLHHHHGHHYDDSSVGYSSSSYYQPASYQSHIYTTPVYRPVYTSAPVQHHKHHHEQHHDYSKSGHYESYSNGHPSEKKHHKHRD